MISRCLSVVCALACLQTLSAPVQADDVFEKPVRLKADGKVIDTGDHWGHSSPCIEDLDGDRLDDLILGDFRGNFHFYKNVGRSDAPVYISIGKIQAAGKDAQVNIYCCVGGQPRFVDLDGDGLRDFISSSYDPGYCYYFRCLGHQKFAAPVELVDKAGIPVRFAVDQKRKSQSFGSFYTPVDWDADGDFDLLIGCFDGHLKLRLNEGNAKKFVFATENQTINAGKEPLKVEKHCCPVVADWDQDGLWDILSGSDDGSVVWFRNVGSKTAPQFTESQILVTKHDGFGYDLVRWSEQDIVPGIRSQIEVVDFNKDGKLDLLLGDFCTAFEFRKNLTSKEKQQVKTLLSKLKQAAEPYSTKLKALQDDIRKRYPGDGIYTDKANEEWSTAYKALKDSPEAKKMEAFEAEYVSQMQPLLAGTAHKGNHSYDLAKSHGYVWLFLRK